MRFGTQKQAIDYCKKDNDHEEWGTKKNQGTRVSRDTLKSYAKAGLSLPQILEDSYLTFTDIRFYEKLEECYPPEAIISKPKVIWICGLPGSGKTTLTQKLAGKKSILERWIKMVEWIPLPRNY
jgi:polynucleotide 5'-kinase involved in rRNA processing